MPRKRQPPRQGSDAAEASGIESGRTRAPGGSQGGTNDLPFGPKVDAERGTITSQDAVEKAKQAHANRQTPRRRDEIIRRQRILRAHGYKVVIDGVWGIRSQRAWNHFQTRGQGRTILDDNVGDEVFGFTLNRDVEQTAMSDAQKRAERKKEKLRKQKAIKLATKRKRERQRQAIIDRAGVLKRDPEMARGMNTMQVAQVITDRETNFNPVKNRAAALAVQHHLRSRGYKVRLTGKADEQTYRALMDAMEKMRKRREAIRLKNIREELYGPAGVKPGENYSDFPTGKIPTAKEMDELIQEGGFTAYQAYMWFQRRLVNKQVTFDLARRNQLQLLARDFQSFLPNDTWGDLPISHILATLYNVVDLAPQKDLSAMTPEEREEELRKRAESPQMTQANYEAITTLRSQVKALATARDEQDFAKKLLAYEAVNEVKFKRKQQEIMAESTGWMGKAVDALLLPGEFLRTTMIYVALETQQTLWGDWAVERDIIWEDALAVRGRLDPEEVPDYDDMFDKASGAALLTFDIFAEPLNFAHPFRATSHMATTMFGHTARGAKLGRYSLTGNTLLTKELSYARGTWSKKVVFGSAFRAIPGGGKVLDSRTMTAMRDEARKLTALKQDAVAKAQDRVVAGIKTGFKTATGGKAKYKKPSNFAELTKQRQALAQVIDEDEAFAPIINELVDDKISLFVDADRTTLSNVGAALYANLVEKTRINVIHKLATKRAREALKNNPEMTHDNLARGYAKIVEEFGVFIKGGAADPALTKELMRHLGRAMDDFEYIFIPAVQDVVEARIAMGVVDDVTGEVLEAGFKLFDDSGLWVHRNAKTAQRLRSLAAETFEDAKTVTIKNPQHGVGHSVAEARELIELEIRRRSPRIYNYAKRTAMARQYSSFDVKDEMAKLRQEVEDAWRKMDDGLYYDTREELQVSALYARSLNQAYDSMVEEVSARIARGETLESLDDLALILKPPAHGPVDDGLWSASWRVGGATFGDLQKPVVHPTRVRRVPDFPGGGEERHAAFTKYEKQYARLRAAVGATRFELHKAAAEVLPSELAKERLYITALSMSQSTPARVIYKTLYGSMRMWLFATLPLRSGWVVRNVTDNAVKSMLAGAHDPRLYFLGAKTPFSKVKSVLSIGLTPLRDTIVFLDNLYGTNAVKAFDAAWDTFWDLDSGILGKILGAHGLPPVPEMVFDGARFSKQTGDFRLRGTTKNPIRLPSDAPPPPKPAAEIETVRDEIREMAHKLGEKMRKTPQGLWTLTADMPENYFKRIIYRSTYRKEFDAAIAKGYREIEASVIAHNKAWDDVTDTLFDYGAISVAEENFRIFFPFVQFWRKNTTFWVKQVADKPWLLPAVIHFDEERRASHVDLPEWMRRYIHTDEIVDAAGVVPGLDHIVSAMLPDDAMFDPMSMASFSPLYRAYREVAYGENQFLPGDDKGWPIVAAFIDSLNDWGLGMNPFIRKPLENWGVANQRAWQYMFPQTSVAVAFTRRFVGDEFADNVASWESAFELLPVLDKLGVDPNKVDEQYDYAVNAEIAGQVARGEYPNRKKAEDAIKRWFWLANLWGYFGGYYWRRATPEDIYLATLSDDSRNGKIEYEDMTDREKSLLKLWSMRGQSPEAFNRYTDMMPLIEAYYRIDDWNERAALAEEYPAITEYVDVTPRRKTIGNSWIENTRRFTDTAGFFKALEIADAVDAPNDVRQAAFDMFVTPELLEWWAKNDTPQEIRDRQIKAEALRYYKKLNKAYHKIPETDYEARDGFLDQHPELVRWWNRNNDPDDELEAIGGAMKADLRDAYFALIEEGGFGAGEEFLKDFGFMFEGTKSEKKLMRTKDGWIWTPGKGKWSAERISDYLAVKDDLKWFFDVFMKKVGEKKAFKWLSDSDGPKAVAIKNYFEKYPSQKRLDYLKALPYLKIYFGMSPADRGEWLRKGSEGAKIVLDFFKKYAKEKDKTEHAVAWLAHKHLLKKYFAMSKEDRAAYLAEGSPDAVKLLAYFKRWGKNHQFERAFKKLIKKYPGLKFGTPEQQERLNFWKEYFSLTPDKRPAYAANHAEDAGIFFYGDFSEQYRHDLQREYDRRAVGLGIKEKARAFLFIKPLLEFYRTLDDPFEKNLFLRANPDLQDYFDKYVTKSLTGNKETDRLVEEYFKIPADSFARSKFLKDHPEVQKYFDKKASPAERAMRALLTQYFEIPYGPKREEFLEDHPELDIYFAMRRDERRQEQAELGAFDQADPRLRPFYENAKDLERSAEEMRRKLRQSAINRLRPEEILSRRSRREGTDYV